MVGEFSALSAMDAILPGDGVPVWGAVDALRKLYDAAGPEMPKGLKSTAILSPIPDAKVLTYNYDEGHAGRVSVPGTPGGSVEFDWVFSHRDFHKLVLTDLAFRDVDLAKEQYSEEAIMNFFVPGLNTLHQPSEGETSTMQRIVYYAKVLQKVPMAQIHIGTSFDQGDVKIDASRAPLLRALFSGSESGIPGSVKPEFDDGKTLVWNCKQIDNIQLSLSQQNTIDTPVKEDIRELLETTKYEDGKPFVLMVYSRGSVECEAALRKYVHDCDKWEKKADIEARLRERVTVLTIGSASHNFPDGPAYIHLAAWTDPLSRTRGMTAKNNKEGAGKDAVFLNCSSPYHPESFDNHNFGAITSQFLSLVLEASKAKNLRDLWEKAQAGEMVIPDDTDRVTRAMIQMTRGYEWLWDTGSAWKDIPMGALPSDEEAEGLLRERMGDSFVDRIKRNIH